MSKLKNHSGAKKRFKATGSGLKMRSANRSHILSKHTTKKKLILETSILLDQEHAMMSQKGFVKLFVMNIQKNIKILRYQL